MRAAISGGGVDETECVDASETPFCIAAAFSSERSERLEKNELRKFLAQRGNHTEFGKFGRRWSIR